MLAILMKKTAQVGGRVSEMARALIEHEAEQTGESHGEILERCLIQCCANTKGAAKLIQKYAAEDPAITAIVGAVLSVASGEATPEPLDPKEIKKVVTEARHLKKKFLNGTARPEGKST